MAHTLVGFYESQDTSNALLPVAALADQHIRVTGDDLLIPEVNQLVAVFAMGTTITRARLVSPSLRRLANFEISPLSIGAEPISPLPIVDLRGNPIELTLDESLNAEVAENAAGAEVGCVLCWLADGPVQPVSGKMFTVRATGTTTLVAGAWTAVTLTFAEDLPVGKYAIVGLRAEAAGLLAARLVFVGGTWRPGVVGFDTASEVGANLFRYGQFGVFGEFSHNRPPQIECLSISADTAETFHLDLIQVG